MTENEKRLVFGQINSIESDLMIPIGTILQKPNSNETADYQAFEDHEWYNVLHSPAGDVPTVTMDGWIPIATGFICLVSNEEINSKTVIAQE